MSAAATTVGEVTGETELATFPACHRCGSFTAGPPQLCLACVRRQLPTPGADGCPVCSQRLRPDATCGNELCRSGARRISRIRAIGYQSGPLRRVINSYKYRGTHSWALVLGRLLTAWLEENCAADPPDLIVANPGYAGPGGASFAHAETVLAAAAAAAGGDRWPFDSSAIVKTLPTLASASAQAWSKRVAGAELRGALRVPDRSKTTGRHILVYDDICTTGMQLDAVAACLLDQGQAARVEAVVLARAAWREPGLGQVS